MKVLQLVGGVLKGKGLPITLFPHSNYNPCDCSFFGTSGCRRWNLIPQERIKHILCGASHHDHKACSRVEHVRF